MNNIDTTCAPLFDSSLYPTGSTLAAMGSAYNILPFLCDLVNFATNPNVDPVLVTPPSYDWTPHVNFSVLTACGDPRFSDGAILSACFTEFLPKIITQLEVKKAGGVKVIDSYVCGPDDVPILSRQNQPVQTTVGNGDINLYGYYVPPNPTGLMEPITEESIAAFYANYLQNQQDIYANAFIEYIKLVYPTEVSNDVKSGNGWRATLVQTNMPPLFYVQLDHMASNVSQSTVYLKYHLDSAQSVLNALLPAGNVNPNGIGYITSGSTIQVIPMIKPTNNAMARMVMSPIPDYTLLLSHVQDPNLAQTIISEQIDNFGANALTSYDTLNKATSATKLSQIKTAING